MSPATSLKRKQKGQRLESYKKARVRAKLEVNKDNRKRKRSRITAEQWLLSKRNLRTEVINQKNL